MKNIIINSFLLYCKLYIKKVSKSSWCTLFRKKKKLFNETNKNDIIKILGHHLLQVILIMKYGFILKENNSTEIIKIRKKEIIKTMFYLEIR